MKFDRTLLIARLKQIPLTRLFFLSLGLIVILSLFFLFRDKSADSTEGLPSLNKVMESYNGEPNLSMQHLDEYVMQGSEVINEVVPFIDDKDPKNRWLAVYVIGRVSDRETVQVLEPLLEDDVEAVRVCAAGTMANKGVVKTIPVLIESLDSTSTIEWLHPEREIADFALEVLTFYTKQMFQTKQEWQQWWQQEGANLTWNSDEQVYQ
ncbi:MAG: Peptidase C14, caspase catalytic subunit p20 [Candidatus Uhrbacteria bacterium GW2011_GWF2_39_13]|uniref:Peptidase C14, caspase catalytic subunit p20 n=1 Tax=Candidatus Uhrbacteria bacterium GW2011_GWF2_39_13 TaxID=1618995 RepID=A0A0G0MKH3_9BACT|nr:MAG: Peptidase C14, caspase catalytic subunit p20 [Candidatus Uhrbacteria bacterium GW2011_GWF2_39_13]